MMHTIAEEPQLFTTNEFYKINDEETPQAERLAAYLMGRFKPRSVVDIGCASGLYLRPFWGEGIQVKGYEIADDAVLSASIPKSLIDIVDITVNDMQFEVSDITLCLEVLEHIHETDAWHTVKNICNKFRSSDLLFFSAAQPGQGGYGHINCQPKSYWETLFKQNGLKRNVVEEQAVIEFMRSGYHMGWFTQNIMVFQVSGV